MTVPTTDPRNPANDPAVQRIASAFLLGFLGEQWQKDELLRFWNSEEGRQRAATASPDFARYYERRTEEELQQERHNAAIAVGVAFAVLTALREHGIAP